MEYGPGKDICVGTFLPDRRWVDFNQHWSVVGPKLRHFRYADDKKDAALLLEDFHIRVGTKVRSGLAGFDYDGSSKPRIVWSWLGHPYAVGGLVQFTCHDFDYVMNLVPRDEADWTMLEGLQAFGGNRWVNRNAVWSAVKIGGVGIYPKTQAELDKYRDHVMLTDLSLTGGKCLDKRLTGTGKRVSIRPEISLEPDYSVSCLRKPSATEGLLTEGPNDKEA
jgi:hypothetical protein